MEKGNEKPPKVLTRKKKKGMSPFRRVTTVLSIAAVLYLTYFVYQQFGVGDGWVWVQDILILVLVLFLVFLAAVFVVWLLMLFRKSRGKN